MDLRLKNKALLFKWLWRFSDDKKALWRNVFTEKYGGNPIDLLPSSQNKNQFSVLWKNIMSPLMNSDDYAETLQSGMGFAIGNGANILFWSQEWVSGLILKVAFPRIFVLAVVKEGRVRDYGFVSNGVWYWNIELRRQLFEWKKEQWDCLMDTLSQVQIGEDFEDMLLSKDNASGCYSPKTFCLKYHCDKESSVQDWKAIWSGVMPPKIETFCWQLLQGKIAVKVNLAARNLLSNQDHTCSLCGKETETISHLFFECYFTWLIWCHWLNLWGIQGVFSREGWSSCPEWPFLLGEKACNKLWKMTLGAELWSIWLAWNEVIFRDKSLSFEEITDLIKVRIATWRKAKWLEICSNYSDLMNQSFICTVPSKQRTPRFGLEWCKPAAGVLTFNVDGSSLEKRGPTGIGGILRNHGGVELIRFSKSVGIVDSNEAELLAVRESSLIFNLSKWIDLYLLLSKVTHKTRLNGLTNHIRYLGDSGNSLSIFRTF